MLQQVTIRTTNRTALEPLLKAAIENERRVLWLGLERTRKRLTRFEQEYGMSSVEFERRLNTCELDETVEFTDWRMEIGMRHLLENQYHTLQEVRFD